MSSRRRATSDQTVVPAVKGNVVATSSKIPVPLQFPLLAILSLTLSGLGYSLLVDLTTAELVGVSRRYESWWEVGVLTGWKTFELALGWYGNYDSYDLASLMLLSHGPPLYLLSTFYEVSSTAVITSLMIDAITTYIPFRLLRPLSPAHAASPSNKSMAIANSDIVTSWSIQTYATMLAATVYAVTVFAACKTYLPVYLVLYFDNIPTIAAAHTADPLTLFPLTLLLGFASRSFIFTPAVAAVPPNGKAGARDFNPETATFSETFWHNVWEFDERTKVVIQRTTTLVMVSVVNTFLQTFLTIDGVAATGAMAYSGVWGVSAALAGFTLGLMSAA